MRGKKFNIWIVYSDLFTNLTTFMVIASIGVMGMIGAGELMSIGLGAELRCKNTFEAIDRVIKKDSFFTLVDDRAIESGDKQASPCHRYYSIGGYRYESAIASIFQLKRDGLSGGRDNQAVVSELTRELCRPIWWLISGTEFIANNGRVEIVGLSVDNASVIPPDNNQPGNCGMPPRSGISFPKDDIPHGFPRESRSPIGVIRDCQSYYESRNRNISKPIPFPNASHGRLGGCGLTLLCLKKGSDENKSALCTQIREIDERDRQRQLACQRIVAEKQAKFVHDLCGVVPLSEIDAELRPTDYDMADSIGQLDVRRHRWSAVSFKGIALDTAEATEARSPDRAGKADPQKGNGQIFLKVQLYPPLKLPPPPAVDKAEG